MTTIAIVGGGLAGAIAVYLLHKKYPTAVIDVFEMNAIGGLMRNSDVNGQIVQLFGPHVFHTESDEVRNLMLKIFTELNIKWETYYLQVGVLLKPEGVLYICCRMDH